MRGTQSHDPVGDARDRARLLNLANGWRTVGDVLNYATTPFANKSLPKIDRVLRIEPEEHSCPLNQRYLCEAFLLSIAEAVTYIPTPKVKFAAIAASNFQRPRQSIPLPNLLASGHITLKRFGNGIAVAPHRH